MSSRRSTARYLTAGRTAPVRPPIGPGPFLARRLAPTPHRGLTHRTGDANPECPCSRGSQPAESAGRRPHSSSDRGGVPEVVHAGVAEAGLDDGRLRCGDHPRRRGRGRARPRPGQAVAGVRRHIHSSYAVRRPNRKRQPLGSSLGPVLFPPTATGPSRSRRKTAFSGPTRAAARRPPEPSTGALPAQPRPGRRSTGGSRPLRRTDAPYRAPPVAIRSSILRPSAHRT